MKSKSKELYGHSIKNIDIKHMLMHVDPMEHFPYEKKNDCVRYVCISCCKTTPEKSTWKIEEVTCKNCLRELKTILHKKDYKGRRMAIYDSQLYPEVEDCSLPPFCAQCYATCGNVLCHGLHGCPYSKLILKMKNGMHDCPECGGEKELLKTIIIPPSMNGALEFVHSLQLFTFIKLYKCKTCGHVW